MATPTLSRRHFTALLLASLSPARAFALQGPDPLPSWRDGAIKRAILDFIQTTTTTGMPDYVAAADRLVLFDNDGTLWPEQPIYTEVAFAVDRLRALAPAHPDWATHESFRGALTGDIAAVAHSGLRGMGEIILAVQGNTTPEAFHETVREWMKTAQHPRFGRRYIECIYQPMREVLALFRSAGFDICIVSGGTEEFLRPWTEAVYGVKAERVIGSTLKSSYQQRDGHGELMMLGQIDRLDEGPSKPAAVFERLGRRPIAAFGNSDGDYEMLQYTRTGPGRRLGVLVHHDDAIREYAYDRQSDMGRLDRGLNDAKVNGWLLTSMKDDWAQIFSTT